MSTQRAYELKDRAKRQDETRRRIVDATVALHEEVGPARTTVAEIARRADVSRLTVYNHFPKDADLFAACSSSWIEANPMPDLTDALALEDPGKRVKGVLKRLYPWYRRTERMSLNVRRDRLLVPALDARVSETVDAAQTQLAGELASRFGTRGRRADRIQALILVALDFWTWHRLKEQGLKDEDAAALMADAVAAA
jgi:AcrR family transcriptional regulator